MHFRVCGRRSGPRASGRGSESGSRNSGRDGDRSICDHTVHGRSDAEPAGEAVTHEMETGALDALYYPSMKELHCIVRGRVQMVMYRDFATRNARRLGLAGYAKNLKDGTVEVLAQGPQDKLEALLARLRKGSFLSRVDAVDASWREPGQAYGDFRIAW